MWVSLYFILMERNIYYDRYGVAHYPDEDSFCRDRAGAFLILHTQDSILFNYPDYAPKVPDLPGGGIDAGENPFEASIRELKEEAELIAPSDMKADKEIHQFVRFAAENDSEFWNYDQTFFLVTQNIDDLYFEGLRDVAEGQCNWIKRGDLKNHTIHHMHYLALQQLDLMP